MFQVTFLISEKCLCVCLCPCAQCTFALRRNRRTQQCTRATRPSCIVRPPGTLNPTSTGQLRTRRWTSAGTGGKATSLSFRRLCRFRIVMENFTSQSPAAFCCCFIAGCVSEPYAIGLLLDILIYVLHQVIKVVTVWSALYFSMVIKSC